MLYLFLDKNTIKVIQLKKTLLGQQETSYFEKTYESDLISKGKVINIDLLASAVKEAMTTGSGKNIDERSIFLVLPQETFHYVRTQVPGDIAPSALNSFIADKARSAFPVSPDDCLTSLFTREANNEKYITYFGVSKDVFESFEQSLSLIDLKIQAILPESLAYFKLFEKTLRSEKKENILYLTLKKDEASGYLFDSYGLLDDKKITLKFTGDKKSEEIIAEKVEELKSKGIKLNRIILSGEPSDHLRQDTFTKNVGVWTNPLKRIVPTFYEEYLKQLIVEDKKTFPILTFDVCFGAFIFFSENKDFSFLKNGFKSRVKKPMTLPKLALPKKEIFLFAGSFLLSFLLFIALSKVKLPDFSKTLPVVSKTPTPSPTLAPSPTPSFKKETLKIKILNGGGVKGKATDVKEILKDKGYTEIITGNADNFDYVKTEVQIKKSLSQAASILQSDLKDYVTEFKQINLSEEDSTADIIIIVGQDFK